MLTEFRIISRAVDNDAGRWLIPHGLISTPNNLTSRHKADIADRYGMSIELFFVKTLCSGTVSQNLLLGWIHGIERTFVGIPHATEPIRLCHTELRPRLVVQGREQERQRFRTNSTRSLSS